MDNLGSPLTQFGFVAVTAAIVAAVAGSVIRWAPVRQAVVFGVVTALWAGLTFTLARSGALNHFTLPPPLAPVLVVGVGLVVAAVLSPVGAALARAPIAWLTGLQSFRIIVELLIHRAVQEGVAPPQMTWTGYNADILVGVTAPAIALLAWRARAPRWLLLGWNIAAAAILAVVVVVGVLSLPTPLQKLHPDNTWIVHAPYVWLPTLLVTSAFLLHAVSLRKLLQHGSAQIHGNISQP